MLEPIVIPQFSYVEEIGLGRIFTTLRTVSKVAVDSNDPGYIEVVTKAYFDSLLYKLQDLERVHHFHDELLRLAHIDHTDVDELLFRGASTAPSQDTAVFMTCLLAARLKTTLDIWGTCEEKHSSLEKRLSLLFRLAHENFLYEEVSIQATAHLLVLCHRKVDSAPMA